FYIYGEVQRPGAFRLSREMTVMQALATGGGTTARGTTKGLQIHRRDEIGRISVVEPRLSDHLQPNDVIFVRESLF
ncbi:MAG: SLBB domain-containing protein, partial [Rhodocyclaceae bacterium]|nr:SLBB domain-containing protein [Rhodocyclaceae bacterium]